MADLSNIAGVYLGSAPADAPHPEFANAVKLSELPSLLEEHTPKGFWIRERVAGVLVCVSETWGPDGDSYRKFDSHRYELVRYASWGLWKYLKRNPDDLGLRDLRPVQEAIPTPGGLI